MCVFALLRCHEDSFGYLFQLEHGLLGEKADQAGQRAETVLACIHRACLR